MARSMPCLKSCSGSCHQGQQPMWSSDTCRFLNLSSKSKSRIRRSPLPCLTGHRVGGLGLMKEITVQHTGQWQLDIGNTNIPPHIISCASQHMKDAKDFQDVLNAVKNLAVCKGIALAVEVQLDRVDVWECKGSADKTVRWRYRECQGAMLDQDNAQACAACSGAWHVRPVSPGKDSGCINAHLLTPLTNSSRGSVGHRETWSLQIKQVRCMYRVHTFSVRFLCSPFVPECHW